LWQHWLLILDSLRFVEDQVLVFEFIELSLLPQAHFKCREYNIELAIFQLLNKLSSLLLGPVEGEDTQRRCPLAQFLAPLAKGDLRHDHDVVSGAHLHLLGWFVALDLSKNSDWLDCFPETHLISQDSVQVWLVKLVQPVQTLDLVVFELSAN
jgi:hypothetical protein